MTIQDGVRLGLPDSAREVQVGGATYTIANLIFANLNQFLRSSGSRYSDLDSETPQRATDSIQCAWNHKY